MKKCLFPMLGLLVATRIFAVVLPPSDDSTTVTGSNALKGAAVTIQVGGKNRGWVKFDLNQLPAGVSGAQISKAVPAPLPLRADQGQRLQRCRGAGWVE